MFAVPHDPGGLRTPAIDPQAPFRRSGFSFVPVAAPVIPGAFILTHFGDNRRVRVFVGVDCFGEVVAQGGKGMPVVPVLA